MCYVTTRVNLIMVTRVFELNVRLKAHLQLVVRVLRSCALCVHFESTCKILVVDPKWNIQSDFRVADV